MNLNLPPPGTVYDRHRMNDMQDALVRAMIPVVTTDTAVSDLFLRAPDGGVWRLSVGPTGTLITVKVQG